MLDFFILILALFVMRLIAALLVALPLLAGCGKKGALYLPDQGQPTQTEQTTK
jgi:predicted small lipoprotein YifL